MSAQWEVWQGFKNEIIVKCVDKIITTKKWGKKDGEKKNTSG